LRIYVGFNSSLIIGYLEPTTEDIYKARHIYCYFDVKIFFKLNMPNQQPFLPLE
jgi:hypothetical protein